MNGEVLTQSPSARGFTLLALPPTEGSWKVKAILTAGSFIGALGLAPPDTTFGWLAKSAVSYVIEESLGFEPNYEETIGRQIRRYKEQKGEESLPRNLDQSRFDSVIEKVEDGVSAMHRPIVKSRTADVGQVNWSIGPDSGSVDAYFDRKTFEYLVDTITAEDFSDFIGLISSYNSNTFKGRFYSPQQNRTLPFELAENQRDVRSITRIANSLRSNAISNARRELLSPDLALTALRRESINGRLKSLYVTEVKPVFLDL